MGKEDPEEDLNRNEVEQINPGGEGYDQDGTV